MDPKEKPETADQFAAFMQANWTREQIIEFCLALIGEEAQAWWARKRDKQP